MPLTSFNGRKTYHENPQFRSDEEPAVVRNSTLRQPITITITSRSKSAANHAVLGHGFESVKAERVQQLYDVVVKLSGVSEAALPKFPMLNV